MKADQILRAGLDTLVQRGVKRDQPDGAADDLDGERRVEGVESMSTFTPTRCGCTKRGKHEN